MDDSKAEMSNGFTRSEDGHGELESDDIAIVGMAYRLPGGCDTDNSFWDTLMDARCVATEFPADRLNAESLFHPEPNRRDTLLFRGAHFIHDDVSKFDAPFFSISDVEAASLDPMQRLLLETSYHALENGLSLGGPSSRISLTVAQPASRYKELLAQTPQYIQVASPTIGDSRP
jgi:hypothetical protein